MPTSTQKLTISGEFLADGKDITAEFISPSVQIISAINQDSPFPAGDIDLGRLSASVPGGTPVKLGDSTRNIAFQFNDGVAYYLEVISDPRAVLKALSSDPGIAPGIDLMNGTSGAVRFMLLKLSYDLGTTAKGTAGLGTGLSMNFGASGQVKGSWDVVHRFGGEGAFDVLKATFGGLRLPRQIKDPVQLDPGTWLISEIAGSIDLNLGVEAGYDFSWLKKLTDGALTGDLGVKVALAATASLGFSANGNYMLALSRPDESRKLRVAIYKLAKKGWNFALNASVGIQGELPLGLENSSDPTDLIRAIFGVQSNQLVHDLKAVQKVAAGGSLTDQAAGYLEKLGKAKLGAVATDIDAFNKGVDTVNTFISQLDTLGERTTSQIFSLLAPGADANALGELKTVLGDIQQAADNPGQIASVVAKQLQGVAFFDTQFGKWLASFLQDQGVASPLSALGDTNALKKIGSAAKTTLDLLNGKDLQTLVDYAARNLDLKNIPTLPQEIDPWLKAKIANFLGKVVDEVSPDDLKKVQGAVNALFQKAGAFYSEAIKAAKKQYEATLVATYENTTTDTALLDILFDFDVNPGLASLLQDAINGDFRKVLIDPDIPGVTLNTGVLTHGFHRQTHVELTLPFLDLGSTSATDVLAKMEVKHDGGSRVLAYSIKANNETSSFVEGRSVRDGQMTLAMNLGVLPGVRKAPDFQASLGYSLRSAYEDTSTRQLITLLTPLITTYALPLKGSDVENWVTDLDKITEAVPTGRVGETRISLDVAVDSSLPNVWLKAPADKRNIAYFALSRRIQQRLRALISSVYFADASRYRTPAGAYPIIVYSSLSPMNSFSINEDYIPKVTGQTEDDVYWDWMDENYLVALMHYPTTQQAILASMRSINQILVSLGDQQSAQFYTPENLGPAYTAAMVTVEGDPLPDVLGGLIGFEADFIDKVIKAATNLAPLVNAANTRPVKAMAAMTNFSTEVVQTFNQQLKAAQFGGGELEMLGSALFTEVTIALSEVLSIGVPSDAQPSALFGISVPNTKIPLEDLKAGKFKESEILVEEKLASPFPVLAKGGVLVR